MEHRQRERCRLRKCPISKSVSGWELLCNVSFLIQMELCVWVFHVRLCVLVCVGLCVLAAYTDSLGVKYLAVLVFIMSPKAMSSFTVSIRFVCNMCACVCACVYMHLCVCPAWHQPRSYAKLPISEAQSIKTPLTTHLWKKKHAHSEKDSHAQHTYTYTHSLCTYALRRLPFCYWRTLTTLGKIHSQMKVI